MIYLVTGKPGHGKSYYCVRTALEALEKGQWLATNVELHDGWAERFAASNQVRRLVPGRVKATAASYRERTYVTHDLEELTRLRLPACGKCRNCGRGGHCQTEARGVMLLDEAHNWLNARTWDSDESGGTVSKAEAVANRLKIVRFFSQHRKLGWTVYLVTQDEGNLDTQVRRNFEYHVHLKNLRRYRLLGVIPIVPVNVFVAVTTWHDNAKSRVGTQTFTLNKRIASCYDTIATSHGLAYDAPDAIYLGSTARDPLREAPQHARPGGTARDERPPARGGVAPAGRLRRCATQGRAAAGRPRRVLTAADATDANGEPIVHRTGEVPRRLAALVHPSNTV